MLLTWFFAAGIRTLGVLRVRLRRSEACVLT